MANKLCQTMVPYGKITRQGVMDGGQSRGHPIRLVHLSPSIHIQGPIRYRPPIHECNLPCQGRSSQRLNRVGSRWTSLGGALGWPKRPYIVDGQEHAPKQQVSYKGIAAIVQMHVAILIRCDRQPQGQFDEIVPSHHHHCGVVGMPS